MKRFVVLLMVLVSCAWVAAPAMAAQVSEGWPLEGPAEVLLGFGASYQSESGQALTHRGIDLAAPAGASIYAARAGTVTFAGRIPAGEGATMLAVTIESEGFRLTYLPLAEVSVKTGNRVETGGMLGMLAATGDRSTPVAHLHVGARIGDLYVDPMKYLASPVAQTPSSPEPVTAPERAAETVPAPASTPHSAQSPSGAQITAPAAVSSGAAGGAFIPDTRIVEGPHTVSGTIVPHVAPEAAPAAPVVRPATPSNSGVPQVHIGARANHLAVADKPIPPVPGVATRVPASASVPAYRTKSADGSDSAAPNAVSALVRRGLLTAFGLALGLGMLWPIWRGGAAARSANDVAPEDVAAVVVR
ncbi:MAG: peptidoglycan DD-metalloendopeptidase family protein [Clostridiales bacterium]|nr:peptidoglycan DD-metalloendopeptidase family protein [Clostridiales bacterium]